uniref:uncharacterized protein LOC122600024 isoform X2 n=1 Tax=Erigeron canadensis TaxID=72917 RepID=UPI001CB8D040|nr:uncharacterized protein LOC122600024 isoform X2 [Erigeron canadensis]XP_043628593.1 uncharacterized protein LOC122600024 isoform X3 [Erigeron canadensis]
MDDEDEDVSETQEVEVFRRVSTKMKSRPWTQVEEEALVKAYINVSRVHQVGNSFWKKVLAEFNKNLGKDSLRNHHQVRSKWKDMSRKVTSFAGIYNNKMSDMGSGTNNEDVFKSATVEYMKKHNAKNGFPHLAAWEVLKSSPKWSDVKALEEMEDSTFKRARTSESNIRSSETDLMPVYLNDNQCDQDDQDETPAKPNLRSSETDLMPIHSNDDQCDQDDQDETPAKPNVRSSETDLRPNYSNDDQCDQDDQDETPAKPNVRSSETDLMPIHSNDDQCDQNDQDILPARPNVRSLETDLMPIYSNDHQCDQDEPPARPAPPLRRKGKNSVQSPSSQMEELLKIVNKFNAYSKDEVEDKKQARAKKLRMKERKLEARIARDQARIARDKEMASLVHEQKQQLIEQQKQQDLEFILKSHDQYTGSLLQTVLARKREIAERWGWDF